MPDQVIVLGANGRFGRAATRAFLAAGWSVRGFGRSLPPANARVSGVDWIAGDAFDAEALSAAVRGCDVIVNALNPPYPRWSRDVPRLTANVIAAATASGATVMIPGNVYNYGNEMPALLAENTPQAPTTRKGKLRQKMEQAFSEAGVQTIVLRAGDFIEREKTGNWFDSHITAKVAKGQVMYPGPLDRLHAWAYLPDMARALVGLAEKRDELGRFEQIGFAGYALTGAMLVEAIERAAGQPLAIKRMPWRMVRLLGLVVPLFREVAEMSYLWDVPHAIDGARLAALLPDFDSTSLDLAVADALHGTAQQDEELRRLAGAEPRTA